MAAKFRPLIATTSYLRPLAVSMAKGTGRLTAARLQVYGRHWLPQAVHLEHQRLGQHLRELPGEA
jgi:hypothetical protein